LRFGATTSGQLASPLVAADPDFDLSDVYPNMLGLSRVGGEGLYMVPSSYDVVTMYYNKTMFEEAGEAHGSVS